MELINKLAFADAHILNKDFLAIAAIYGVTTSDVGNAIDALFAAGMLIETDGVIGR